MNKVNKGIQDLFEKEEEGIMEPTKNIKDCVRNIKNFEHFNPPMKANTIEFDMLELKTAKVKNASNKFVEDPKGIMKELDIMKNLLNQ